MYQQEDIVKISTKNERIQHQTISVPDQIKFLIILPMLLLLIIINSSKINCFDILIIFLYLKLKFKQLYHHKQSSIQFNNKLQEWMNTLQIKQQKNKLQRQKQQKARLKKLKNVNINILILMESKLLNDNQGSLAFVGNSDAKVIYIEPRIHSYTYPQKKITSCYGLIEDYSFKQNEICFAISLDKSSLAFR
ncbi:unnamed protein product [Paramecium octaurelia]|uniref:Transmembrane protein n=1 Tax=Paramecium octaurelia TaxID=43137 RepID=A0A8S1WF17_PAROT|nr:unnamed protein product [Paramecium octaurelia]